MTDNVWVAVTVLPDQKAAQVEAFDNEGAAEDYVEYSEENAPEGVATWVQAANTELKSEFEP